CQNCGYGRSMNLHCECPAAGFCGRHQMKKSRSEHQKCQGTANTRDCGLKYWQAWERGEAGATAPADPILHPQGFCEGHQQQGISRIGTTLAEIIKRDAGGDAERICGDCLNE